MNNKESNLLLNLYSHFSNLPIRFRELASEECNWSTPTFYRKLRGIDKADKDYKGRIIPVLSRAEKDAILRKALEAYQEVTDFLNSIKNNL